MNAALAAFARETGFQVARLSDVGEPAVVTNAVKGVYSAPQALDLLLEGSGYCYRFVNARTIAIVPAPPPAVGSTAAPVTAENPTQPSRDAARSGPNHRRLASYLAAMLSALGAGAMAQDARVPADPTSKDSQGIEEVIVTARKQEESLQDVPITVTAFSAEALAEVAPKSLFDLNNLSPGLNFQDIGGGRAGGGRLQMRGISGGTSGASRAALFLDGIFLSGSINNIPFGALERVEVMPGPQSTQFGRSTFAGAMNYVTRDPGRVFSGRADLTYGSDGEEEAFVWVGGPLLGERLRGSVHAFHQSYEGDYQSVQDVRMATTLTRAFGGKLIFDATDDLSIELRSFYSQDWDGPPVIQWIDPVTKPGFVPYARPNGTTVLYAAGQLPALPFDPRHSSRAVNPNATEVHDRRNALRSSLQADYAMGDYSLTFSSGYFFEKSTPGQYGNIFMAHNLMDFIGNPNYALNQTIARTDHVSAELRLASPQERRFRYELGLFYEELEAVNEGVTFGTNVCNTICSLDVLGSFRVNTVVTPVNTDNLTRDRSVFGAVHFDLTDSVTVSLEGRYQREYISNRNGVTNLFFDGTWNAFLPRLNLQFKASEDMQFYVVYSVGNNPGGFNTSQFLGLPGTGTSLGQRQVEEEKLNNYELGMKSTWLDNTLMVNASVYHQLWKDMQLPAFYFAPGGGTVFSVTENRGSAKIDGLQLEVVSVPVEGLDLRATISYNAGEYTNFCSNNYAVLLGRSDLAAPNNCLFVNGAKLENVPRQTRSFSAGYTRPLANDWKWFARTSYQYQSGMWVEEYNVSSSPSGTVFTGDVGFEKGPLRVELYCRNCSDEDSPTRIGRSFDLRAGPTNQTNVTTGYVLRRPRNFGIRMNYSF